MHYQMANQHMISELPVDAPLNVLRRNTLHVSQTSANQAILDDATLDAHVRLLQEVNTLIAAEQARTAKTKRQLFAQPARQNASTRQSDALVPAVIQPIVKARSADKKQGIRQPGILQKWSAEIQQLERETSIQIAGLFDQRPDITGAF